MPQRSLIDVALPRSTSACRRRPTWGRHLARAPGAEHLSWRSSSTVSLTDEVPEPDEKHDQPSEHERHDLARFVVVLGLANARPNVVLVTRHDSSCASPVVDVTPCGRSAVTPVLSIARSSGVATRAARSWGMGESEHPYDAADGYDVEDRVGPGDTTASSDHEHPEEGEPRPSEGTPEFAAVDGRSDPSARARRFASKGLVLARAGRHAGAERLLRQAVGAFSRRGERSEAGRAAFDLGQLLLERGRTRDATTAFESARGMLSAPRRSGCGGPSRAPQRGQGARSASRSRAARAGEWLDRSQLRRRAPPRRRSLHPNERRPGHLSSVRPLVAQRAIDTGLAIPPGQYGDGVEAAAPIRYGGRTVGALMSRWPADVSLSTGNATALLAAAAAACAPDVCAAIDRLAPQQAASRGGALELIGSGVAIDEVRRAVQRAASTSFPVLIEGDSGSGKELVARAVHRQGPRHDRTFCAVNCAAIADELFEAELFGHARGAFTGATGERAGLFEEADRGTLFLDEVSELSARAQAKLLRAIQEGEIRRVGENFARKIDARLIAATNRSLSAEVAAGRFRRDLFYRVNVVRIVVPPLHERVEDIPALANHFWTHAVAVTGSRATLDPATFAALARYDWPGNVRELQNVMTALAVSAPRRGRVSPSLLPAAIVGASPIGAARLEDARRTFEQRFVRAALARAGGHRGRAAADLGLSRQGLAKLLKRLGLCDDQG